MLKDNILKMAGDYIYQQSLFTGLSAVRQYSWLS